MAGSITRRAPYKDYLQPALQRRFMSTAGVLLGLSYVEALVLARWDSYFWPWFPIGPAGFRTLFLFFAGLAVILLRISQYHAGLRTSNSALHTFYRCLVKPDTYETLVWYTVSSLIFCPIFLRAPSDSTKLDWVQFRSGDRARLNENPLFLVCYLCMCAFCQAVEHLWQDQDRLSIGSSRGAALGLGVVLGRLPRTLLESAARGFIALAVHVPVYFLLVRPIAWRSALLVLRPFYSLPRTNMLPPTTPFNLYTITQCLFGGFLLFTMWKAEGLAFTTFMAKEPLKNHKPLTSDSKDPNGSLLNGLKSKKLSIRSFALWELLIIAQNDDARRKAIFEDIDRKDGPMWSQIYDICLSNIRVIGTNMDEYSKPATPAVAVPPKEEVKPRITAPLKQDPIFQQRPVERGVRSELEKAVAKVATSPGNSPISQLRPKAKMYFEKSRDRLLSDEQKQALSTGNFSKSSRGLAISILRTNFPGSLLRQDFRRRLTTVLLGTPYAELGVYSSSAQILSLLAVHSLAEDKFGNVWRDVPTIIRSFTSIITRVETFRSHFPEHWTDVEHSRETPEVDEVLLSLKKALGEIVDSFQTYSHDLRLSLTDVRLAKEASELPSNDKTDEGEKGETKAAEAEKSAKPKETEKIAAEKPRPRVRDRRPQMVEVRGD